VKSVSPIVHIEESEWESNSFTVAEKKHFQNLQCAENVYLNFIKVVKEVINTMLKNI
jgi:hypothetical protein